MADFKIRKIPPLPKKPDFLNQLPGMADPGKAQNRMRIIGQRVGASLGFALLLLVVANRMSTSVIWSNGVLCVAWFVFLFTIYEAIGIIVKKLTLRLTATMALSLIAGVGCYYFFWVPAPRLAPEGVLSVSVVRDRYEPETQELVAKVQFANSGDVSRTVMGVAHMYRTKDMPDNEWKVLANSADMYGDNPINVDPKKPVVVTFRRKIEDRLAREEGTIFGLALHTLSLNGRSNYTDIEAMEIRGGGETEKRVEGVSLDEPWDKKLKVNGKHIAVYTLNLPTKHEIATELAELAQDGIRFQERFTTKDIPTWDELNVWREDVAFVLGKTELADAYRARFDTSSGFEGLYLDGKSMDEGNRYRWVQQRVATLREFIKEFSSP
jgi:hypothetical protein